jgi:uroporphyrinogen decarboxylase
MNHRELVSLAIEHKKTETVPKGEICISPAFIEKLIGKPCKSYEEKGEALEILGLDIVVVAANPKFSYGAPLELAIEEINWWRRKTQFYIFALVEGPFQGSLSHIPFEEYCRLVLKDEKKVLELAQKVTENLIEKAKRCILSGADGIIIADDIACNRHTLLSPGVLRDLIFSQLKKAVHAFKELGVPVFYHSDGNINSVLKDIANLRFDGIHSLQPSAQMNMEEVKRRYGEKLTLWGNIEFETYPQKSAQELVERSLAIVSSCSSSGGFIFGSSAGLSEKTPVEAVLAVYQELKEKAYESAG